MSARIVTAGNEFKEIIMNRQASTRLARYRASLVTALVVVFALVVFTSSAQAEFGIVPDSFSAQALEADGLTPDVEAGGHPFQHVTSFDFNTVPGGAPDGRMKDVIVEMPAGFVGDPTVTTPICEWPQLVVGSSSCPRQAQVGLVALRINQGITVTQHVPVFNMNPAPGDVAAFGFNVANQLTAIHVTVPSETKNSLRAVITNASTVLPIVGSKLTLWGVPADSAHDAYRGTCLLVNGNSSGLCPSNSPARPFLTNPTECADELTSTIEIRSWEDPSVPHEESFSAPPVTGCEEVPFNPGILVRPMSSAADSPSGLDVTVGVEQNELPNGRAASHLKDVEVTFPEGMSVNPATADGLDACSEAEVGLGTDAKANCPDASKLGTVEIVTPVLEESLKGAVYQAEQDANPFDSMLALYFVAGSPDRGVTIKLASEIAPDASTGRLVATFLDNPQLPFSEFKVRFKGGARAPLATPASCGIYQVATKLTPWARPGEPLTRTSSFTIDKAPNGGPCKAGDPSQPADPEDLASRPFNPEMKAGVIDADAGGYSPFVFQLIREDGDQEILSTTVNPPRGLTAKLAGIPYCSEADIVAGSCPEASRIGTEIAGAGAGSSPFYTTQHPGKVYLAGPYKDAPLSMVIQEPVVAGPLDLDDITVRAAIHVDPRTAQLTVISDEIPQINSGIPLRIRDLRIRMDRPEFTIAPTNCEPMQLRSEVRGSHGATAELTNHFQVSGCGDLGFSPKLKLDFGKAKKNTKPNAHPPLNAKLRFNPGDANISRVQVALPKGLILDQDRIGRICSRDRYAAGTCPESSRLGYARATTPLLDDPVEGPVYLKASDNTLPDLAADLDGQIDVDLFGRIDQKVNKKGVNQIRNTFDVVPDVPVSSFELTLDGGSDGLLVNSQNICKSKVAQRISIEIGAHNEMALSEKPLIGSACKQINKKKAKKLNKKAKNLLRKAKRTDSKRKAKQLRKQARKLKRQAKRLGR